jgi:hypothetical protein
MESANSAWACFPLVRPNVSKQLFMPATGQSHV